MRMRKYGNMPPIPLECLLPVPEVAAGDVRKWPILAIQVMKFTRGRPTAVCDPDWTFERKDPLELTITPEPRLDMRFCHGVNRDYH